MLEDPLIEGIANEVLLVLSLFVLAFILIASWTLTRVNHHHQQQHHAQFASSTLPSSSVPPATNTAPFESPGPPQETIPLSPAPDDNWEGVDQQQSVRQRRHELIQGGEDGTVGSSGAASSSVAPPLFFTSSSRPPGAIALRIKYLNDRQKFVYTLPSESIVSFKRINFSEELRDNLSVRLIFNGRELKEDRGATLSHYGLNEDATLHCLVSQRPASSGAATSGGGGNAAPGGATGESSAEDMDLSGLMFPLFGAILSAVWYCRLAYRQYFSVLSSVFLLGLTILFIAAVYASWMNRRASRDQLEQGMGNNPVPQN